MINLYDEADLAKKNAYIKFAPISDSRVQVGNDFIDKTDLTGLDEKINKKVPEITSDEKNYDKSNHARSDKT